MQPLRIEDLLRYTFSGGLFVLTLILVHPIWWNKIPTIQGVGDATVMIGLVLLAGSLIYTLHRALTYPFLFFPATLCFACIFRAFPFEAAICIPFQTSTLELDFDRWRYRLRREQDPLNVVLADWGAQVHFLYCSGLAIVSALLLGWVMPVPENVLALRVFSSVAIIALLAGFVHNLRLLLMLAKYKPSASTASRTVE